MAKREPKPYFKKSHQCFYVNLHGKPVRLDADEVKATAAYHALMAGIREVKKDTLVLELIAEFLSYSKQVHAKRTHEWYKENLKSFHQHIGNLSVGDLRPYHVEQWVRKLYPKTKNPTTIGNALRTVKTVFNRATRLGKLTVNPLAALKIPKSSVRDVYLMPDQYRTLVAAIKDELFREFIEALRETGCRPQELRTVEARHFDRVNGCWVFPKQEAKGGWEERVIRLTPRALAISNKMALKNPDGPMFRNRLGNAWRNQAICLRCNRLSKKLGFHICPYAIRHTFATDAIIRGVDLISIAHMMGHKTLHCLTRIYQHVQRRGDHLYQPLLKATEGVA